MVRRTIGDSAPVECVAGILSAKSDTLGSSPRFNSPPIASGERTPMTVVRMFPVLLLTLWLLAPSGWAQAREMVSIDRPEANMRAGAGTRHPVLWVLSRGYPLAVTGRAGNWLKVRDFENDQGWVHRSLTGRKPHLVVRTRVANLRSAPSTNARIVGQAGYGEVLRTVEHRRGWAKVRKDGGLVGWVSRRLLWGW